MMPRHIGLVRSPKVQRQRSADHKMIAGKQSLKKAVPTADRPVDYRTSDGAQCLRYKLIAAFRRRGCHVDIPIESMTDIAETKDVAPDLKLASASSPDGGSM